MQLRQDRLLELIPGGLRDYLSQLHQANADRNAAMRRGLEDLLHLFSRQGIVPVLLKGAATFCDDLYNDPGARIMGDLDLLVKDDAVEAASKALLDLGYQDVFDPGKALDGIETDERHHQLPRYVKPGTPLAVEIHFKVSYAQAGRVLAVDQAWQNILKARLYGIPVTILNPTWRLLHNSIHALLPHREFIRGDISLAHLAEFDRLKRRYARQIDWRTWEEIATRHCLTREMCLYRQLAEELISLEKRDAEPVFAFHRRRILTEGQHQGSVQPDRRPFLPALYYYLNLPRWVWDNIGYMKGPGKLPQRLIFLFKKALSSRSRAKLRM